MGMRRQVAAAWQRSRRKGPECRMRRGGGSLGRRRRCPLPRHAAQRTQTKSTGCCDFRTIASKVTDGQGLDFGLGRAEPSPDPLRNKLKLLPACFETRANFKKRSTRAYVTVTVPQNPVAAFYQVGGLLVPSTG